MRARKVSTKVHVEKGEVVVVSIDRFVKKRSIILGFGTHALAKSGETKTKESPWFFVWEFLSGHTFVIPFVIIISLRKKRGVLVSNHHKARRVVVVVVA